ncbi:MAG: 30S ribosomal protein S6 [Patescibacteria group bacterium]
MTKQYELLYIIPATFTDDDVGGIESNVKALLEKYGATIDSTERLGKFKFAYPIKKVRHGHYIQVRFTADGDSLAKIDEALRISPEVLRQLILRADEVGSEKYELIQFTEVNLDNKESDDRPRRRREDSGDASSESKDDRKAEISSGVAVLEGEKKDDASKDEAPAVKISAEELDKKIDSALKDNAEKI